MEKYDYRAAVKADILEWIKENQTGHITDERREEIQDELWTADSVTGNGSGSYTFSAWVAEENICHNLDLIQEVIAEFGPATKEKACSAEYWDVCIRCMLLGEMLGEAVEEWNAEHPEEDAAEEEEG